MPAVTIDQLTIADRAERWAALGFAVEGEESQIGAVRLRFTGPAADRGIAGWSLRGVQRDVDLDGLPTEISREPMPPPAPAHPNGAVAIDHVVAATPAFERTLAALRAAGLDLRRVREQPTPAGAPRQAFFRLGAEILELIQEPAEVAARHGGAQRPARFWGLALVVEDLEATLALLGESAGEARDAVQPGRRIASVRRSAGLAVPLALMSAPAPREEVGA
ncbi:MAG TPA: hypothetical protein VL979_10495 [Solirubrobacteraceae bacterium]|nr:hypothetical protein [Solirubrobacteraceae bacterium]